MSLRRWVGTTALMCAVAWALRLIGPGLPEVRAALADPQGFVDRAGADALVLVCVPLLAWLCWAWGALGLVLTGASTLPGWTGRLAGLLLAGVLPAGARRAAAVALGIGLSAAAPVLLPSPTPSPLVATAAAAEDLGGVLDPVLVDWPTTTPGTVVRDWPQTPAEAHVVLRGDCLWDVAADWLQRRQPGTPVSSAAVHEAARAWWQANATVIGPDPDLLVPGQVLRPPR